MIRYLPLFAAAAVLTFTGVVHGLRTGRWVGDADLRAAEARLAAVPTALGDWKGQDEKLDDRQLTMAQVKAYVSRRYQHGTTGEKVTLLLVCGRPGAMAVHTPDVCYPGAGFEMTAPPVKYPAPSGGGQTTEFWKAAFARPNSASGGLHVFWAWGTGGEWAAPDYPRLTFAHRPALYKLYLISQTPGPPGQLTPDDPALKLLEVLLPKLKDCLAPAS
jgi:hypothetical protein